MASIPALLDKNLPAEELQIQLYELTKTLGVQSKEAFAAIYLMLIGKNHGPKAAWLLLSLERTFLKNRIHEATTENKIKEEHGTFTKLNKPEFFHIQSAVKEMYPTISVGVAIIKGVTIKKTSLELETEKQNTLQALEGLTTEQLSQFPEIVAYRKLYKAMGIDWHSRRPSPEALLRRIALKKGLYTVNTCVDAYNLVVIKNRVSVGAFDLDTLHFPTELKFPIAGDTILLLGDDSPTEYKSTELSYFDRQGGFNIDFNYRDSQRTAVQETTKNIYINVDGIYEITPDKVESVLRDTCDIIIKYCGGNLDIFGVETVE